MRRHKQQANTHQGRLQRRQVLWRLHNRKQAGDEAAVGENRLSATGIWSAMFTCAGTSGGQQRRGDDAVHFSAPFRERHCGVREEMHGTHQATVTSPLPACLQLPPPFFSRTAASESHTSAPCRLSPPQPPPPPSSPSSSPPPPPTDHHPPSPPPLAPKLLCAWPARSRAATERTLRHTKARSAA